MHAATLTRCRMVCDGTYDDFRYVTIYIRIRTYTAAHNSTKNMSTSFLIYEGGAIVDTKDGK